MCFWVEKLGDIQLGGTSALGRLVPSLGLEKLEQWVLYCLLGSCQSIQVGQKCSYRKRALTLDHVGREAIQPRGYWHPRKINRNHVAGSFGCTTEYSLEWTSPQCPSSLTGVSLHSGPDRRMDGVLSVGRQWQAFLKGADL